MQHSPVSQYHLQVEHILTHCSIAAEEGGRERGGEGKRERGRRRRKRGRGEGGGKEGKGEEERRGKAPLRTDNQHTTQTVTLQNYYQTNSSPPSKTAVCGLTV